LTCAQSISPSQLVVAGKEVDVSIWDLERVFAKGPVPIGVKAAGKRKKGEWEDGEVWRAKNVSQENEFLASLRLKMRVFGNGRYDQRC
jgi:ribosome biogenesis protein NSA1